MNKTSTTIQQKLFYNSKKLTHFPPSFSLVKLSKFSKSNQEIPKSNQFKNNLNSIHPSYRYIKILMSKTLETIQQKLFYNPKKNNRFPLSFSLFSNHSKPHSNGSDGFQTFFWNISTCFHHSILSQTPKKSKNNQEFSKAIKKFQKAIKIFKK